jgi:hypothetical protein
MTDWFARPVLHVKDVKASLRFYVNQLGFTSPWRYDEDGKAHVAQVDGLGCALILADTWPEKIGKGLMFISSNAGRKSRLPRWTHCGRNSRSGAFRSRMARGATGFWWSMISTAISSSSTIRTRPHPARLLKMRMVVHSWKESFDTPRYCLIG